MIDFSLNPWFTDESATCVIISEDAYAVLVVEPVLPGIHEQEYRQHAEASDVIAGLADNTIADGASPVLGVCMPGCE